MRITTEQDTQAIQLQLLKICDYDKPHEVHFQDGSMIELTPAQANAVLNSCTGLKPSPRAARFRVASLGVDIFTNLFGAALQPATA